MINLPKCCYPICPTPIFSSCHLQCSEWFWHLLSPPSSSSHLLLYFVLSKASWVPWFPPLSCLASSLPLLISSPCTVPLWNSRFLSPQCVWRLSGFACSLLVMTQAKACVPALVSRFGCWTHVDHSMMSWASGYIPGTFTLLSERFVVWLRGGSDVFFLDYLLSSNSCRKIANTKLDRITLEL